MSLSDKPRNPDVRSDWIPDEQATANISEPSSPMPAVPVQPVAPVPTSTDAVQSVSYFTLIIPVSVAGSLLSAIELLPQDPLRQYFYVQPIDGPIVLASSLSEAQAAVSLTSDLPTGVFSQTGWSPELHNKSAVYAGNPSTSSTCRVSVIVESMGSHAPVRFA
jgi:hypothetical protein